MVSISELETIVSAQRNTAVTERLVSRNLSGKIKRQSELVTIITGARRSGKSTLLHELMTLYEDCHFLNFEDFRLTGFDSHDFINLDRIFNNRSPGCNAYFFDEIQNISGWESYVRTLNDTKKTVFLTGSNASLLSSELGTKLTGRHIEYALFPMDFSEYCSMKQISDPAGAVDGYLAEGGFPQYLKTGIAEYLQQIVNDILYRDIVKRHNVRNIAVLEELVRCLFSNVANEYSIRNLSRITNASSLHTITEFMGYLEDAYLFFSVPVFSYSFRQRSIKPRKVYSIDNGLTASNTVSFTRDLGKMLENAVFIGLKRKFRDIFYFKGRGECDFVIRENNATHSVIQVCYQLTSENLDRELRGLDEATGATRCSNALIVTRAESGEYRLPGGVVARAIPIVEWFDMLC